MGCFIFSVLDHELEKLTRVDIVFFLHFFFYFTLYILKNKLCGFILFPFDQVITIIT